MTEQEIALRLELIAAIRELAEEVRKFQELLKEMTKELHERRPL